MYIKVKDRKLFKELDEHLTLPKRFDEYVTKIYESHNLIIKQKGLNKYYCTNCGILFEDEKLKINKISKCPNCHKKLIVKSSRIVYYTFEDEFVIIDKYMDKWILRYFHIKSKFATGNIKNYICEYARQIYDESFFKKCSIVNEHFCIGIGSWGFNYDIKSKKWRYLNEYCYFRLNTAIKLFPYNLRKLFKNTEYKYSGLWTLASKIEELEIIHILKYYNSSVELLIKLKLYNLAQNPQTFKQTGSFLERFGLPKTYLQFMQKYNITISELNVLKYTKEKEINVLRKFSGLDLQIYKKYKINLKRLIERTDYDRKHHREYIDYLNMSDELGYNMTDKKILYPAKILEGHDRLVQLIKIKKDKEIQHNIKKRYEELKDNIFKTKKYIIYPAKNIKDFIDESRQQNNCVKTYMEKYSKGICDIYFMRLNDKPKKSLVTIEVKNNEVVQQRIKNNMDTTKEQKRVIKLFETKLKGENI